MTMEAHPAEFYPYSIIEQHILAATGVDPKCHKSNALYVLVSTAHNVSMEINVNVLRVGSLSTGVLVIEVKEDIAGYKLCIPIDWVERWWAIEDEKWPKSDPSEGKAEGLRFLFRNEISEVESSLRAKEMKS